MPVWNDFPTAGTKKGGESAMETKKKEANFSAVTCKNRLESIHNTPGVSELGAMRRAEKKTWNK